MAKKVKNTIPQLRLMVYLLLAGTIPIVLAIGWYRTECHRLEEMESQVHLIALQTVKNYQQEYLNQLTQNYFREADHHYIDHELESAHLLQRETKALKNLTDHDPSLPNKEIARRLQFLERGNNRPTFQEGVVESFGTLQETRESLAHPIEVDVDDLVALLTKIEGTPLLGVEPPKHLPQLLITDFHLKKKRLDNGNEVYLLDLKLIKREYT